MSISLEEIKRRDKNETLDYHNFEEWHAAGYDGKNINFLEIESPDSEHGQAVRDTFMMDNYGGNAYLGTFGYKVSGDKVIDCTINYYGAIIPIKQFIEELNIHIIGASLSNKSGLPDPLIKYLKTLPVIWVGSAGNKGSEGVTGKFRNLGIMSAAIYLDEGEIKKERYSAIGELVDFATLHSWREGTSFSSPVLARMMADIMSKYGFIEQDKMYEILKSLVIDAGEEGHDPRFGHGVPVLPENCTISILENPSPIKPPSPELPELDPVQPPVKPPTPIELPGEEYNEGSEEMPYMYLVRYSHLDKILVKPGAHLKPAIAWGGKVSPATKIGLQGDTGLSTGNHLLISVVKVPFDKNFKYVKYSQEDMYKGAPEPSKEQLDLFVDETLFEGPYKITVGFNDPKYYSEHGRHHPSYCVVPLADNTIYWNRSFAGRVIATGYDNSYGKYVVAAYSTLEFDSYREENTTTPPEPIDPINVGNVNDVSKTWINSAGGYLYQMTNKNSKKTQYGQTTNFDGKVRYIEVHPNNMGIVDAFTTIERTGYSGINGTFFWYDDDSRRTTTSTSILKIKDKILQENANHLPYPQGVFCYYRDGTFGIEKVKNVKNLSKPTWWAIGGIEMVKDNMVTYNSSAEGFIGKFADVHRKTNRSAIGINKEGNILLVRSWQSTAAETAVQMRELGCIYAIGLDGGGSTQYATPGPKRLSSREVDHLFVAADLKL